MPSKLFAGLAGVAMALACQLALTAPIVNGGFETGDLAGWSWGRGAAFFPPSDAGAGVVDELLVPPIVPVEGNYMAMVSNGGTSSTPPLFLNIPVVNHGLPVGVVNGAGGTLVNPPFVPVPPVCVFCPPDDWIELWQTFSISGAPTLQFDWNFLTNEFGGYDYAFIGIIGQAFQLMQVLVSDADPKTGELIRDDFALAAGQYSFRTGWHSFELGLTAPGNYTLVFGVVNAGEDNRVASALLIDNVRVCSPFPGGGSTGGCFPGPGPFPAPEPTTLALLGIALAGLGFSRRKRAWRQI